MAAKRLTKKVGAPPGTLVYTGEREEEFRVTIIDYGPDRYERVEAKNVEDCFPYRDSDTVTWVDITGLHNIDAIRRIGEHYGVHPLVLEDVLNVHQRPKVEYFENYVFVVLRMLTYDDKSGWVDSEQVSFVMGRKFVLTFQERPGDVFDPIRKRIETGKAIVRRRGTDYLLYALMDVVVDNYFVVLEKIGDEIEGLEDEVVLTPSTETVQAIHRVKRNLIEIRKSIWPLREALGILYKDQTPLIDGETQIFFRDVYDHTIQVIDMVETFRDLASGLLDVYLSSVSNKMNEIMKVLTVIATVFIPLTWIAGIYGMNFKYMPEPEWKWGYPAVLLVMLAVGLAMLAFFRRKRWL